MESMKSVELKFSPAILHLTARLARLKLSPADEAALAKELPAITAFVGQLRTIPAKASSDSAKPLAGGISFRSDASRPPRWPLAKPEDLIAASPAHRQGFITVPHVFSS